MKKALCMLIIIMMINIVLGVNITTINSQNSVTISQDTNFSYPMPQGSHVSLAQLNLYGNVTQNLTSDINITYVATVLEPEDLDLIPGTSDFFVVDKYHRVYKVNSTFGLIQNITIDGTCGDGFTLPHTDHDYYGVSAVSEDLLYIMHYDVGDTNSLLVKLNFTDGNNNGCKDYWKFSDVTTIEDVEDVYVDSSENYAYITQSLLGVNNIYKVNISNCNNDCYTTGDWSIETFAAANYESIDSEDNGNSFWVTSSVLGELYYLDSNFNVQETYDIGYDSGYDAFPLRDTLGHTVNHTTHWIIDTEEVDELYTVEIAFPYNVVLRTNTTIVFNHTGWLKSTNVSINLSPSLMQDVLETQNSVLLQVQAQDYGNLTLNNIVISYESFFECSGASTEVVVYNFTLTDEDNDTTLTGDLIVDITYNNTVLSYETTNTTNIAICMAQDTEFTVNGFVQGDVGYVNKYYFANANISSNNPQNITFYNKGDITDYSDLVLTVRDESFLPYPSIIGRMERYYPEDHLWKAVQQDISDSFGQQFFNIREEDIEYRIYFYSNSTLLDSTDVVKFICESGLCQASFQILDTATDASTLLVNYTLDNATGIVNVSWNDGTGGTSSVRVYVYKDTMTGTQDICDTSVSSPSGSIGCNVSEYNGDIVVHVYSPSTYRIPTIHDYITLDSTQISDFFDAEEYALWSFILLLVFVGMGAVSPVASVITTMFGMFIISLFGLNPVVNVPFVIIIAVLGTVVGVKLKS